MGYREKIYKNYSSKRTGVLAPESVSGFKSREPYLLKIIKEHFPANKNAEILELGCGYGAFQFYIQQAGYTTSTGIDGSEEQVKEAHRLGMHNIRFANLVDYIKDMQDSSVDLLIVFDVIEHFNKTELSDLADVFYRVLKKGGKIICHAPNAESPFGSFMRSWDFTHEIAFTRQSIAQLFLSSGFSNVRTYEDKPIPHGAKSFIRYILWEYFIRKLYRFLIIVESGGCDKEAIFSQNFLAIITK